MTTGATTRDPSSRREVCTTTGKQAFRSPERAEKFRKFLKRRDVDRLTVYRCEACELWHIGHTLGGRKRRRRRKARYTHQRTNEAREK